MEFIPTERDVADLLRRTGALRDGHFECPSGYHTDQYLETALVMRSYANARILSVGLSRLVRGATELRAAIPELSVVAATPAGLPVACCLCEALRARQVYWAEKPGRAEPMQFPQYMDPAPREKVLLVDDVLRSGVLVNEAKMLLESRGAEVLGLAVLIHQPTPLTHDFGALPLYTLARLDDGYYALPGACQLCKRGVPVEKIGREPADRVLAAEAR